jgi:hypothetical protein
VDSSPKRLRTGPIGNDVIVIEDSDSEVVSGPLKSVSQKERGGMTEDEAEKVGRDERTLDPRNVLKLFRVDQKKLA